MQVRDGSPRRRDHSDRAVGALRQAQCEEAGRALVDPHVQSQQPRHIGFVEGDSQSRRTRAGGEDHVAHATVE